MKQALVIATYGRSFLIETSNLTQIKCTKKSNIDNIVVGDQVLYKDNLITNVLERKNLLKNMHKNIVSNINIMFITIAINPHPNLLSIDSYLLKAESLNIKPIIVLNKIDLLNNNKVIDLLSIYSDLGYKTLQISVKLKQNLDLLKKLIANNICVFLGHSGVGKSSIINAIAKERQQVDHLGADGLGKHTTTNSTMFKVGSGNIIDTPGVREFNPSDFTKEEIKHGFVEINNLKDKCKFRNCNHLQEPGCKVLRQLELNKINKYRYQNYSALIQEVL